MVVYEDDRLSYREVAEKAVKAAGLLRDRFGIRKGDKVAIVSRNYPEWIVAFWAIQLIGGVAVSVNALLPSESLHHCITLADSRVSTRLHCVDVRSLLNLTRGCHYGRGASFDDFSRKTSGDVWDKRVPSLSTQ